MSDLKYPPALTPAQWAKNKGLLAKSKPTGIGEALTKLAKAHEAIDLSLFDADKLDTAAAVQKALDSYEKDAKKNFVRAFQEAKTVEDVASTAAVMLKKAALVPKSAVDAASAVSKAAADYAVDLTSARQNGVKALEDRLEHLRKAEAEKDDDEDGPVDVVAGKLAKKVAAALKLVKDQAGDTGKPVQLFVIAAGKTGCSLFVGPHAGSGQKPLLKKVLPGETGTLKYYVGQCIWEAEAHTFVGDDIPLGGFAKRLRSALLESTGKKYKLRIRRTSGETDQADEEDGDDVPPRTEDSTSTAPPSQVPEPPKMPEPPRTGGQVGQGTTGAGSTAEQVLALRLKQLMPRLEPILLKGGEAATALRGIIDKLKQHIGTKDFGAATQVLDLLEERAKGLGAQTTTTTKQAPTDLKRDQLIEKLLEKLRSQLVEVENAAKSIPGTPTYKTAFLRQRKELEAMMEQLVEQSPPDLVKRLSGMPRRIQLLRSRVDSAAVDGPKALDRLKKRRDALAEAKKDLGALTVAPGSVLVPALEDIERRLNEAARLIDNGDFAKAKTPLDAAESSTKGIQQAKTGYAAHYPAYKVERDKAVLAIANLKKHKQSAAIQAEIQRIEDELRRIDCVATASKGWQKAKTAVGLVVQHCSTASQLADRLDTQSAKLPELLKKLTEGGADPATAQRLAGYAHKLLVEENCSEDEALAMARDADDYVKAGLNERDARVSATVCRTLTGSGVPRAKALVVGRVLRAGGTADAGDAKAVGLQMARMSVEVLENLAENNLPTECFRGGVTEVMPACIDDIPRGWESLNLTWDHVPGMFSSSEGKVLVGTMSAPGSGRKVPGKGEVSGAYKGKNIAHGTDDLVGHEAGHAFDVSDGDVKSKHPLFRAARLKDIATGNLAKAKVNPSYTQPPGAEPGMFVTRDNYFVVFNESGVTKTLTQRTPPPDLEVAGGSQADIDAACSETFAESFAMHFAGTADRWPALRDFWQNNPWGV